MNWISNFFQQESWTNWKRKDFGDEFGWPPWRVRSEKETNQDLQKSIQQLICDVHEQARSGRPDETPEQKQVWMSVRVASMMGRVALEHERVGKRLVVLTWVLVWLTVVLASLTFALVWIDFAHH